MKHRNLMKLPVLWTGAFVCAIALAQSGIAQNETAVFRSDARLVEAYTSVFDKHGNPLPNLASERFQILDGGQPQEIAAFEGARDNVSCAMLLDVTGSMEAFLPSLKIAAGQFVDQLRPDQQVALYTFTTSLKVGQAFTTDKKLVKQALLRTRAGGGTALFDAVSNVTRDLEARKGKKALVLFTDGADNASMLDAGGASRRARLSGVPIYAIAQGEALQNHVLLKTLGDLATESGGLLFRLERTSQINEVFSAIVHDLNCTYLVQWKMPQNAGEAWRPLKITVAGEEGARIRSRQGYYPK
jgi:VWFA-related protein